MTDISGSPGPSRLRLTSSARAVLTAAIAVMLCSGCPKHPPANASPDAAGEIALIVENHHWSDVIVWVVHEGVAERIGTAPAVKTSSFFIPNRKLGNSGLIQLRGRPVGSPEYHTTESFLIRAGQEIQWTLESDLTRSSVAVH
jgi:hypothetical protein